MNASEFRTCFLFIFTLWNLFSLLERRERESERVRERGEEGWGGGREGREVERKREREREREREGGGKLHIFLCVDCLSCVDTVLLAVYSFLERRRKTDVLFLSGTMHN